MDQTVKTAASIGFVDTYENGHFTGWTYTNIRDTQAVSLNINTHLIKTVLADLPRPDVKAAGLVVERCGFDFTIDLESLPADGCIISIQEPVFNKPLDKGTYRYSEGKLTLHTGGEINTDTISVNSYIKVTEAASACLTPLALLELAMSVLGKAPLSTFIAMSYFLILGRTPDPEGFHNSLRLDLSSTGSKNNFMLDMISSGEFQQKRSVAAAIHDLGKYQP